MTGEAPLQQRLRAFVHTSDDTRPVVHQDTWARVTRLAARWGQPEWKVMHLAVVVLEQTAPGDPLVADLLRWIEGDLDEQRGPNHAGT